MHHVHRTFVVWVACLALMLSAPTADARKKKRSRPASDLDAYEQLFHKAWPTDRPGGAVIVTRAGEVLYRDARGLASVELGVPLAPDMVFRLGSITKQFTAAGIMKLVDEGKIALDDPITKFLPDYPTNGHTITVEHLLTHTSGIYSYTNIPGYMVEGVRDDLTVEELIDVFENHPMEFAPGERFNYNNSGYVLLGAVIEKVSGQTYAEFIDARIFKPLGMTQSYYGGQQIVPRRVRGYEQDAGGVRNMSYLSMSQPYAAGSLLSTVDDLARWNRALFAGEVVSRESLQQMITPYRLANGDSAGYGYGLVPGEIRDVESIGHGGGIHGFRTQATYVPAHDVFVAVLHNSSLDPGPGGLANKAAAIAIGQPYREFTPVELSEADLRSYVGVYRIDDENERFVMYVDGGLVTQRTDGAQLPIQAAGNDEFFYDQSLTWIKFVRDADGRVAGMDVFQGGGKKAEPAERIADRVPEPTTVKLDAAALQEYVGTYELAPGFELAITVVDDALHGQATGQPRLPLIAKGDDVFAAPQVGAKLTFERNADGGIKNVRLEQGGQTVIGPRK